MTKTHFKLLSRGKNGSPFKDRLPTFATFEWHDAIQVYIIIQVHRRISQHNFVDESFIYTLI